MDVNILLRGQSNALLFADRGGLDALEQKLEAATGADIHILSEYGTDTSTIYSGTAFLDWDTDGEQAGLLTYLSHQSADIRDNPTVTLWLHNEYEQKGSGTKDQWLREVRADAELVRDVLHQGAETTPYLFTPVPYNYGQNWSWYDGMLTLSADGSFNASMSNAFDGAAMDGDGYQNSSHMGDGDVRMVAAALAEDLLPILAPLMGSTSIPAPTPTPTPTPTPSAPVSLTAGKGADSLVLKISQDAYQGSAQYTVTVDGKQVGGTFTASALHGSGQSDTLTLKGDWAAGAHKVAVQFLNDAWGGSAATDRNLHVDSASYNGAAVSGAAQAIETDTKAGSFSFTEAAAPAPTPAPVPTPVPTPSAPVSLTAGKGADSLVLKISQDAYQGSAQYTVTVDGKQVGGTFTASALHGFGQSDTLTLKGDWAAGAHKVAVQFLNDAWGGSAATDRNLHVDSASYNGAAVSGAAQAIETDTKAGSFSFTEAAAPAPTPTPVPTPTPTPSAPVSLAAGSGADSLVLKISQDAYQGSAQYTVTVDGKQVGGTFTASALHGFGQSDTLTLKGDWAAGAHKVAVQFLNDAWGGSAATDRNLHVDSASYNGAAVSGAAQAIETDTKAGSFSFTEAAAPAPTPIPVPTPTPTPSAPAHGDYSVVLADDFSQGYKWENWGAPFGGGVYWNGAWSWNQDDVNVRAGEMQVTMTRHEDGWWTGGGFNSFSAGKSITYGTVEFDAKVEEAQGTQAAILMWPASNDVWPPEIDILETPGHDVMHTLHWAGPQGQDEYDAVRNQSYDPAQWHSYKMTWLPDLLKIEVDGKTVAEWTDPDLIPDIAMGFGVMGYVGAPGDWIGGAPDASTPDVVTVHIDNVVMSQWNGIG
ncbi:carbohydrate-binding domain-containing protein [Siccirubricoccus sp. G192]|uniref:carbohydrate-binding domain-containing protein n=1 Tax=Siccirubricoccus sp. G192 TaxID=2849651 RepID=UPI001C2C9CB6|nr:carbohydrate-binding domain-containing protein [Siccirubricoccus sp. G192]MBV1798787.1 family 16 glycosylhydrolase [Siccirubricoccus sp. G192]